MVQGLASLRNKLTRKIPQAVEQAAKLALEKNANELVAEMKRLVPVDKGHLRDSIAWTWGNAPAGTRVLGAVGSPGGKGTLRITVYAGGGDAFYAWFQEFGTVNMAPNPFFFPSYRKLKRRMKGRVTRSINKSIKAGSR